MYGIWQKVAHFEQVPRAGGLVTNRISDNNSTEGHIPDILDNRALLENVANDAEIFGELINMAMSGIRKFWKMERQFRWNQ